MSQDLHTDDGGPLSGGRFYLRLAVAAVILTGGAVLLVWYTNR